MEIFEYKSFVHRFPVQTDDSRCGIYVCKLAKSIVFKRRIYLYQKLYQRMRAQVAREMYSGSIILRFNTARLSMTLVNVLV